MPDLPDLAAALRATPDDKTLREAFADELMEVTGCSRTSAGHVAHSIYQPVLDRREVAHICGVLSMNTKKTRALRATIFRLAGRPLGFAAQIVVVKGALSPQESDTVEVQTIWENDVNASMPMLVGPCRWILAEPNGIYVAVGSKWMAGFINGLQIASLATTTITHQNEDGK